MIVGLGRGGVFSGEVESDCRGTSFSYWAHGGEECMKESELCASEAEKATVSQHWKQWNERKGSPGAAKADVWPRVCETFAGEGIGISL